MAQYERIKKQIVPELVFNQALYEKVITTYVSDKTVWLEAGCGHKILPSWREKSERALVQRAKFVCGCDGDQPAIQKHRSLRSLVVCDMAALPFKFGVFNLITCNMVAEHLVDPASVFAEFSRTLAPEGVVVVHTPNRWGYFAVISSCIPQIVKNGIGKLIDARKAEDYYPVEYRCNTPKRLGGFFANLGMKEVKLDMYASDAASQFLGRWTLGRLILRIELYLIRLSLKARWRFLRVTLCGVYQKSV